MNGSEPLPSDAVISCERGSLVKRTRRQPQRTQVRPALSPEGPMEISEESQLELALIFENRSPPDGHFLFFASTWLPLIYGADGPQRVYLDLLLQWYGDADERDVERFPKADHPYVSNYLLDWSTQGRLSKHGLERDWRSQWDVMDPAVAKQESERRSFASRFNASKSKLGSLSYDSLAADPTRTAKIIKGIRKDNPSFNPSLENLRQGQFAHQIKQFSVRRACKFLIYDGIREKRVIAYALDDLNLDEVVNKTARQLENGRFKVPVCTSELRELFRRWDYCSQWVIFFEDLHRVNPPWHPDRGWSALQGWAKYASERAAKLASQVGDRHARHAALLQVTQWYDGNRYAEAIQAFHLAGPSTISPLPNAVWEL